MKPRRSLALARLGQGIRPGLRKALGDVNRVVKKEVYRNLSGRLLQVRSGLLRSSFEWLITRTVTGFILEMGYDLVTVPYARIQALGGRTGRNYATRIRKTAYLRKALVAKQREIRSIMAAFVVRLARGR